METKKLEEFLSRGVENIYPKKDFLKSKLDKREKLRIYAGIDPTGESLHLGHAMVFRKLAKLHEMGHTVILLIGSFTAKIGDPTGKMSARVQLTDADIKKNMKSYIDQLSGILDFNDKKNPIEVAYNDSWLAPMSFADVVSLSSHFTVHQMLERDMFQERIKAEKPIFIHEFLYPLMQGSDSVALDVDMEIGGNDQTFNMLAGRTLMKEMKEKEKIVMTLELLTDAQGKKMSKTDNNFIALTNSGNDMYGKIMSWPDEMIEKGFRMLTDVTSDEIAEMIKSIKKGANPRDVKMKLAYEVVRLYKSETDAKSAQENFTSVFSQGNKPTDIETIKVSSKDIIEVLVETKLATSKTDARKLLDQKSVKVNDEVVAQGFVFKKGESLVQKGKRHFIRVEV